MKRIVVVSACLSAALVVSACNKKPEEAAPAAPAPVTQAEPAAPAPAPAAPDAKAAAPVGTYDTTKAAVSTVKLGAFPYLALPAGYIAGSPQTLDLARFPVWVGDHFVWVEGKVYQSAIEAGDGKTFSKYEVQRNIESVVAQAGGKKIAEAQLPSDMREKLNPDAQQVDAGLGDIISNPVTTFLIHQADRDIWVNFVSSTTRGSWAVIETKPFVASATLLPAGAPATP